MRMMLTFKVPVATGSRAIKSGDLPRVIRHTLERLRPESAYFYLEGGQRTMRAVFQLPAEKDMVPLLEPLMIELDGALELTPVMTADDLQAGFKALG